MSGHDAAAASGFLHVSPESKAPYAADVLATLHEDAALVIARYPQKRSALLPLLHLVQSVDGYVAGRGVAFCAEVLDLTEAEVSGVATFYTQYKRHPNGEYTVGVCTNTLCAVMGGDQIFDTVSEHLGIGHDETTTDGKVTLERIECNAACDYAPVVMTNWEFFDNQTPQSTVALVDELRAGNPVKPTRGADSVCTFKQMSRVLAGFHDDRADEGVGAGPASLLGLRIAHDRGWVAPGDERPDGTRAPVESDNGGAAPAADAKTDAQTEAKTDAKPDAAPAAAQPDGAPAGAADAGPTGAERSGEGSAHAAADADRPTTASEGAGTSEPARPAGTAQTTGTGAAGSQDAVAEGADQADEADKADEADERTVRRADLPSVAPADGATGSTAPMPASALPEAGESDEANEQTVRRDDLITGMPSWGTTTTAPTTATTTDATTTAAGTDAASGTDAGEADEQTVRRADLPTDATSPGGTSGPSGTGTPGATDDTDEADAQTVRRSSLRPEPLPGLGGDHASGDGKDESR